MRQRYILLTGFYLLLSDWGGFKERAVYGALVMAFLLLLSAVCQKGVLIAEGRQALLGKALMLSGGVVSVFTGIDRGESIFGCLRLAAILVMSLAVQQIEEEDKIFFLRSLPIAGLISLAGCFLYRLRPFQEWISAAGRWSGPFRYANTMALFLTIGIAVEEHFGRRGKRIVQWLLAAGLFATGSRTGFVLLCGYLAWRFIRCRRVREWIPGLLGLITLAGGMGLAGGKIPAAGRFLKLSIHASTLQGRLLYWEDAAGMLWKRPAGLGYMGYFYLQQAEQTGVYSVRFVHNEWLQWILDYGILAGIGLAIYLFSQCKNVRMSGMEKEVLVLIALYGFFDFHLQFFTIVMIVLLLIPKGEREWRPAEGVKGQKIWKCGLGAGVILSACLCIAAGMADYSAGKEAYGQAVKWNPLSARYKQAYLLQSENLDAASAYAERLLLENHYLYPAYLIRSNAAAQNGQLADFIMNRRRVLLLRKYDMDAYEEYLDILFDWRSKAQRQKNVREAALCEAAMKEIAVILKRVRRETNVRAYRIKDKPALLLRPQYQKMLEEIEKSHARLKTGYNPGKHL